MRIGTVRAIVDHLSRVYREFDVRCRQEEPDDRCRASITPSITPIIPGPRDLDAEQQRDIDRFERAVAQYLAGEISEDVFRVMRLNNGIYGQRQGGTNQMVRIKLPAGTITPEQLDLIGHIAETYSRGWGHITTRQNVQFHFVELDAGARRHA